MPTNDYSDEKFDIWTSYRWVDQFPSIYAIVARFLPRRKARERPEKLVSFRHQEMVKDVG